jgi:thymidylate synthase (FAD)
VSELKIDVLDKGYVRYDKHMGSDLDVVNSAKVSFDRASASFEEKEARLLAFLVRDEHTSTFRHSAITLEVYAPLLIARQWFKYAVASSHLEDQFGWNESSRRYLTENVEFHTPENFEWRAAPENRKQGSGGQFDPIMGNSFTRELVKVQKEGERLYNLAMEAGIAPEQARLFLPAYGLMVRWRWTFSLGAGLHFLHQRLAHDAQSEIREYAEAVRDILAQHFPHAVAATLENS